MEKEELIERTRQTADKLFTGPAKVDTPYGLWKSFDPELAKDLSLFITGNLYSRTVLPLPERQIVAVSALTSLNRIDELKVHLHGALNVGITKEKLAEAIFQVGIYAGFPVVNAGLVALRDVLQARGEWHQD